MSVVFFFFLEELSRLNEMELFISRITFKCYMFTWPVSLN